MAVLPSALSLPAGWEPGAVVIVLQSKVALLSMVLSLWWLPKQLLPSTIPREVIAAR